VNCKPKHQGHTPEDKVNEQEISKRAEKGM
jgi:hypothetical protein